MSTRSMRHRPLLKPAERELWRSFVRVNAALMRRLDDELRAETGLSLSAVEVLWVLTSAPGNRVRMTDLAEHLVFTRSGVTRLVDRLERDGLVVRGEVDEDARGRFTILTRRGFELFEAAAKVHVDSLRGLFFAELGEPAMRDLASILHRLEERLGPND
jgi:DNA-binding MarR family transcriptional regulator